MVGSMNREIKFRAWNTAIKKMYKVGQITMGEGVWSYYNVDEDIGVCIPYQSSLVLMQYTGLKDKNGVEIYEGDIVHIPENWEEYGWASGENYEIDFKEGRFRMKPKYKPNAVGYDLENTNELEVIGNVFENGDLLKESEE